MSKIPRRKRNRRKLIVSPSRRRRQVITATAVGLSLVAGWTMLAYSGALNPALRGPGSKPRLQTVSPASFSSNIPSKEYIFAGSRLLATETDYSISPTYQSFAGNGLSASINVTAPSTSSWTAVSNDPSFITIISGGSGVGNGTVNYSVAANSGSTIRSGTITVNFQTFTVYQGINFLDVPSNHPYYDYIGRLSARGVTLGCGGGNYCPDGPNGNVTRAQMAVFFLRALGTPNPPAATAHTFCDVPPGASPPRYWAYDFIEEFYRRGLTSGCAASCPGSPPPEDTLRQYCPESYVTHDQMSVFILRALGVAPPAATVQHFYDVPTNHWAYSYIEEFYRRGIWSGCAASECNPPAGMLCYCPGSNVTRAQMAVLLVRAFNL